MGKETVPFLNAACERHSPEWRLDFTQPVERQDFTTANPTKRDWRSQQLHLTRCHSG
jgi:hypothetical protein